MNNKRIFHLAILGLSMLQLALLGGCKSFLLLYTPGSLSGSATALSQPGQLPPQAGILLPIVPISEAASAFPSAGPNTVAGSETGLPSTPQTTPLSGLPGFTASPSVFPDAQATLVTESETVSVSLIPSSIRLSKIGDTSEFRVLLKDSRGNFLNSAQFTLLWTSEHPDLISVDQDGKVTALQNGFATITITVLENQANASGQVQVTTSGDSTPPSATGQSGVATEVDFN